MCRKAEHWTSIELANNSTFLVTTLNNEFDTEYSIKDKICLITLFIICSTALFQLGSWWIQSVVHIYTLSGTSQGTLHMHFRTQDQFNMANAGMGGKKRKWKKPTCKTQHKLLYWSCETASLAAQPMCFQAQNFFFLTMVQEYTLCSNVSLIPTHQS